MTAAFWDFMSSINDFVREVNRDCPSSRVTFVPAEVAETFEWVDVLSSWAELFAWFGVIFSDLLAIDFETLVFIGISEKLFSV